MTRRPKTVLDRLADVVDPTHSALLVIDVQNDCCSEGGAFARRGADLELYRQMLPQLRRLLDAARDAGVLIIFIQATTLPGGLSQSPAQLLFEQRLKASYPAVDDEPFDFCLPGTWGHDFVDDVRPHPQEVVVRKHRSSGFVATELDLLLRSNGIRTVIATGCTTEGCVDSTVRDAGFLDYYPLVVRDCVASDNKSLHDAALHILSAYRAWMVLSDELVDVWAAAGQHTMSEPRGRSQSPVSSAPSTVDQGVAGA